jgi:hypothetical protein
MTSSNEGSCARQEIAMFLLSQMKISGEMFKDFTMKRLGPRCLIRVEGTKSW